MNLIRGNYFVAMLLLKEYKTLPVAAFPASMLDALTVCSELSVLVLPDPGSTPDPCSLPRRSLETCQMFTKVFHVYLK